MNKLRPARFMLCSGRLKFEVVESHVSFNRERCYNFLRKFFIYLQTVKLCDVLQWSDSSGCCVFRIKKIEETNYQCATTPQAVETSLFPVYLLGTKATLTIVLSCIVLY